MGRNRVKRKQRFKTRRALLIVFLFTFIALALIGVASRQPAWFFDLSPNRISSSSGKLLSDSVLAIDFREGSLPAIIVVVSLSGISVWAILIKANR